MTKLPARQPHRGPRPRKPAATVSVAAAAAVAQGLASRIVAAARELLFESGLPGLTTERLARLAGVSKTSIYKCFPELPLLLEAVVAQEAAKITHGLPQELIAQLAPGELFTYELVLIVFKHLPLVVKCLNCLN